MEDDIHYTKHFQLCDNALENLNNQGMQFVNLRDHMKLESENEIQAVERTLISIGYAERNPSNSMQIRITGEGDRFHGKMGYRHQFITERKIERALMAENWQKRYWAPLMILGFIIGFGSSVVIEIVKLKIQSKVPPEKTQVKYTESKDLKTPTKYGEENN